MRYIAFSAVALAGCGGAGSPSVTPAKLRTDAQFCYYGMNGLAANETADHASCVWAADFYGPIEQMAALSYAKASGRSVVLMLPGCSVPRAQVASETRFVLQRLQDAQLLTGPIIAAYWCDEADDAAKAMTDEEANARIAAVRTAMADFDGTRGVPIAGLYQCASGRRPGLEALDWTGCDRYDHGCAVFTEAYADFERWADRRQGRKLMAIAGGADPWRQDSTCWEAKVEGDPRYAGLFVFIYQTVTDHGATYTGVRDNGRRKAWCDVGRRFQTGDPLARCAA